MLDFGVPELGAVSLRDEKLIEGRHDEALDSDGHGSYDFCRPNGS